MIQNHFDGEEEKKFHKNLGKASKFIQQRKACAQDFEKTQGVKNCPILCVRLKTMAVFRPEKKEVDPQKLQPLFKNSMRVPKRQIATS